MIHAAKVPKGGVLHDKEAKDVDIRSRNTLIRGHFSGMMNDDGS